MVNRRNTASGALVFACVLTTSTTLATVLLTVSGAENQHYLELGLGVILSVIWGLVSLGLGTATIMSLRDEVEYETFADEMSQSLGSSEGNVQEEV